MNEDHEEEEKRDSVSTTDFFTCFAYLFFLSFGLMSR